MFFGLNQNSWGLNINQQIGDAKICFFSQYPRTPEAQMPSAGGKNTGKYWKIAPGELT